MIDTPRSQLHGVAFIVIAIACFAALDTTTKVVGVVAPVATVLWVRYLFQTLVTGAAMLPRLRADLLRTGRPGLQLLRAILLMLCSALAFFSLRSVPVGEFTAIVMLTPLIVTFVAALGWSERVSWPRWACLAGGFTGSLLVIRPGMDIFRWAMVLPVALVVVNTAFQFLTSRLARTEDPRTTHFYTGFFGLVLSSVALPFTWGALPGSIWIALVFMGALGTLGHFLLILAYRRAPVAVLTPYLYLQIGFAAFGGWLVFSHLPDALSFLGIAIVGISGVVGTWLSGREAPGAVSGRPDSRYVEPAA